MRLSPRARRASLAILLFLPAYAAAWLAYRWIAPPYARAVAHATEQAWAVLAWSRETPRLEVVEGRVDDRPAVAMLIERPGADRTEGTCALAARLLLSNLPAVLALLATFPGWSIHRVRRGLRALCWLFLFHMLAVRVEVSYLEGQGVCGTGALAASGPPGILLLAAHSLFYRLAAGPEAALGLLGIAVGIALLASPGSGPAPSSAGPQANGERAPGWRTLLPVDGLVIAGLVTLVSLVAHLIPD